MSDKDFADQQALQAVLDRVLSVSKADETEALIAASDSSLTRYQHNSAHESVNERNCQLSVRAVVGKRQGVAGTNKLDEAGITEVVRRAYESAKLSTEDPVFPGLPGPGGEIVDIADAFDQTTATATPDMRAAAVNDVAKIMRVHSLYGAGYVSTQSDAFAIANTKGVKRFHRSSDSAINIKAIGSDSSGYAEGFSRRFDDLEPAVLAERAAKKAVASKNPRALDPGKYTVILEAPAFREFLGYLSWIGFGAQAFEQGSSFMSGHLGEKLVGENVSIRDDYTHPLGSGIPFDFEGVPRTVVPLIERGIAKDVVYDSYYAAKLKHKNTGHALPAPHSDGPMPLNIVVDPGNTTVESMIRDVQHGVLMTRSWYIRLVDQKQTLITGMTRDGLFLIERGRLTKGLKNMRFNESIIGALGRCELASALVRSESHVLPAVKIEGFNFSSGTEF
ncbi:MAG TPA: TldD/PmbA family protein [Candidatus Eremiobacteraceae bacterium]|nr:TldD/PmbA family protein [Candidatus Eremiobacteraceae bacterium]